MSDAQAPAATPPATRHDWSKAEIRALYDLPLFDLVERLGAEIVAHHRAKQGQSSHMMPPAEFREMRRWD